MNSCCLICYCFYWHRMPDRALQGKDFLATSVQALLAPAGAWRAYGLSRDRQARHVRCAVFGPKFMLSLGCRASGPAPVVPSNPEAFRFGHFARCEWHPHARESFPHGSRISCAPAKDIVVVVPGEFYGAFPHCGGI